jgi:hypothetical protein
MEFIAVNNLQVTKFCIKYLLTYFIITFCVFHYHSHKFNLHAVSVIVTYFNCQRITSKSEVCTCSSVAVGNNFFVYFEHHVF